MKERPILFSAPMVRAILEGRKAQTRRVVKPQPDVLHWQDLQATPKNGQARFRVVGPDWPDSADDDIYCPYGQPGDRLWVRETFKEIASGEVKNGYGEVRYGFAYQSDATTRWNERPTIIHDLTGQPATGPMQFQPRPWKPSIHMPRRACRLVLEITDVRVERLRDISEADAIAEGIERHREHPELWQRGPLRNDVRPTPWTGFPKLAFQALWEGINGTESWDANPWVWAITFKRVQP